jgi:hypothetical protein
LVEKSEGKRPLGRPRRRWVDNIEIDLGEIGSRVNTIMNLQVTRCCEGRYQVSNPYKTIRKFMDYEGGS